MAVENWIDDLCAVFDLSDGKGGTLKSYRVYEKAEFPEAITQYPCAISYLTSFQNLYNTGEQEEGEYRGVTELHLFPNVNKSNYPELMLYVRRVRNAFLDNQNLDGGETVAELILRDDGPGIEGPVILQYGSEDPHMGMLVHWIVREYTMAGG